MANEVTAAFAQAWRDYETDGVEASGKHQVELSEARAVGPVIQSEIDLLKTIASAGLRLKSEVRAASLTNVTLSSISNGASFGGVTVATGDRIAPIGQSTASQNGIYVVQSSGAPVRATDADSSDEISRMGFFVTSGTNAGKVFACGAEGTITVGSTALPFYLFQDASALVTALNARQVLTTGLATGGGNLSTDRTIDVAKADSTTVLNGDLNDRAITPSTGAVLVTDAVGPLMTDEEFAQVLAADASGYPLLAVRHDGSLWALTTRVFTDAEFECGIIDENGVVLAGKRWEESWQNGPFYSSATIETVDYGIIVTGSSPNRKVQVLTNKVVPITFGEVDPAQAEIKGSDAVYRTISGTTVTTYIEDLLARTTLDASKISLFHRAGYGQSLSNGVASSPALSTTPVSPGRILMFNGGIRALGTGQSGSEVNTVLPKSMIKELVDAYEVDTDGAGETPMTQLGVRYSQSVASTRAFILSAHGIGGAGYSAIKKGTVPYANMLASIRRGYIMSQLLGLAYTIVIHLFHGEADRAAAQGVYKGYLVEFQADITADVQAITGQTTQVLVFVSQMSNFTSYGLTTSFVPSDMAAAARENPTKIVLVGPRYHLPTADGVHLINTASAALGDMHGGAEVRYYAADKPALKAVSAVRSGATITVTCDVPTAPIVRDTTLVTDPALDAGAPAGIKYGFIYQQTGGTARTITDVTASGSTITVTLSGDPGSPSAQSLRIAMDGVAGADGGPTTGARACFRDSSTGADAYGTPRYNWICADIIPVT